MTDSPSLEELTACGLPADSARKTCELWPIGDAVDRWSSLSREVLSPAVPFETHQWLYDRNYTHFERIQGPPPFYVPGRTTIDNANLNTLLKVAKCNSVPELHQWSLEHRELFWETMVRQLGIVLQQPGRRLMENTDDARYPDWLAGSTLNITDSCFSDEADRPAIIESGGDELRRVSSAELKDLVNRLCNGLSGIGLRKGDAVGIVMPMSTQAVALYLALIRMGAVAVSIADSFSSNEIARRLELAGARIVATVDATRIKDRELPVYEKIQEAGAERIILCGRRPRSTIRPQDIAFDSLVDGDPQFESVACSPDESTNVLFSSGTTGTPKAIPWTHTTPIKCAADGYLYQNITPSDVVAWPTNMGWMMGPWLIYASLINRATIALYAGHPASAGFCRFVEEAGVTVLGVVPSLVSAWKQQNLTAAADWTGIKVFSSTGECSNPGDMLYLSSRAGYCPIIEYCGGTEIGGGYISSTVVQPSRPACFATPAMGIGLHIRDEDRQPSARGEVFLEPPSIGLSTRLLHSDHNQVYYSDTPTTPAGIPLRRHGDEVEQFSGECYQIHGRVDDAMNLSGIKISAVEIETVAVTHPAVQAAAAVAVAGEHKGPARLVLFVVPTDATPAGADAPDENPTDTLRAELQQLIKRKLNPQFAISDLVFIDAIPRTASNKTMRRILRDSYQQP